jgi:hypothetical protein
VVSFFGTGTGTSSVGWVPLGPEEPYFPAYPVTVNYVRVINRPSVPKIVNVTNISNVTQVTKVVKVVKRRPVLVIGSLVNRRAATVGGGSLSFNSGGFSVSVGQPNTLRAGQPAQDAMSPGLVTTGSGAAAAPLAPKLAAPPAATLTTPPAPTGASPSLP